MRKHLLLLSINFLLFGCTTVTLPQISGQTPCQVQVDSRIEQAIYAALDQQHWVILAAADHWIKAQKTVKQMQATIEIAYGYCGFSVEYRDSRHMHYDAEHDVIDRSYVKWVMHLKSSIYQILDAAP